MAHATVRTLVQPSGKIDGYLVTLSDKPESVLVSYDPASFAEIPSLVEGYVAGWDSLADAVAHYSDPDNRIACGYGTVGVTVRVNVGVGWEDLEIDFRDLQA